MVRDIYVSRFSPSLPLSHSFSRPLVHVHIQLTASAEQIANVEIRALVAVVACVYAKAVMGPSVPVEISASAQSPLNAASVPHAVSICTITSNTTLSLPLLKLLQCTCMYTP